MNRMKIHHTCAFTLAATTFDWVNQAKGDRISTGVCPDSVGRTGGREPRVSDRDGENISPFGLWQPWRVTLWRPTQHDAAAKGRLDGVQSLIIAPKLLLLLLSYCLFIFLQFEMYSMRTTAAFFVNPNFLILLYKFLLKKQCVVLYLAPLNRPLLWSLLRLGFTSHVITAHLAANQDQA